MSENDSTCPNCGYCKYCGRSNQPVVPFYPAPYVPWWVPYYPTWVSSPTVTTGQPVTSGTLTVNGSAIPFTYTAGQIGGD